MLHSVYSFQFSLWRMEEGYCTDLIKCAQSWPNISGGRAQSQLQANVLFDSYLHIPTTPKSLHSLFFKWYRDNCIQVSYVNKTTLWIIASMIVLNTWVQFGFLQSVWMATKSTLNIKVHNDHTWSLSHLISAGELIWRFTLSFPLSKLLFSPLCSNHWQYREQK